MRSRSIWNSKATISRKPGHVEKTRMIYPKDISFEYSPGQQNQVSNMSLPHVF